MAPATQQPQSATSTPLPWILIIRAVKGYSHSFRITCDGCALSLLESREQRYIKTMHNDVQNTVMGDSQPDWRLPVPQPFQFRWQQQQQNVHCPWNFFFFVLESKECECQQRNAMNRMGCTGEAGETSKAWQLLRLHQDFIFNSLSCWKSMQLSQEWWSTSAFRGLEDESGRTIWNLFDELLGHSWQRRIIIKTWQYQGYDTGLGSPNCEDMSNWSNSMQLRGRQTDTLY